ncbi:MAG: phenylalanine--tRNA ligase subunit beta [Nitrososphaerota archaeon]|nr:phenylalanine--tRNA ligase subunit beta [Nitrososphaerota archaeon]
MPVIQVSLSRLSQYCRQKVDSKKILETLPYLGLDIEDQVGDSVTVEYSPNRPDYSSEAGIARSLVGLLGIDTGLPKYEFESSNFSIKVVGKEIAQTRPHIAGIYAEVYISDEVIKQLIEVQEDLHNGIGRKRSKVAIGIHNAAVVKPPIQYYGETNSNYSFIPLGGNVPMQIKKILEETEQGVKYRGLLTNVYPLLVDSQENVLSMPPIINGELTRLKSGISSVFVDITGTEERTVDTCAAIIAAMLSDMKAKVKTVTVEDGSRRSLSPNMSPRQMKFDLALVNDILGFQFSIEEATRALEKSRLEVASDGAAQIPKFRHDIIHPIDLVEEVALGYGIAKMEAVGTKSSLVGAFNPELRQRDRLVEVLVGLGLTEVWNLSLTSFENAILGGDSSLLKVDDPKSQSFEYLRSELMTSLLGTLGASTHLEYPQRIFEQAIVFKPDASSVSGVREDEHVAVAIADSNANYSLIHSILDAFLRLAVGSSKSISLIPSHQGQGIFSPERCAQVTDGITQVGHIGEVSPEILEKFNIRVPVVGFEINIGTLLKE